MLRAGGLSPLVERRLTAVVLVVFLGGVVACVQPELAPTAYQQAQRQIVAALINRNSSAFTLAHQHLERFPNDAAAIALAAEAAARDSNHELAMSLYRRLPADGGRWEFLQSRGLARRCDVLGRIDEAETHLRRALELSPNHLEANERLGHILQVEGRVWESAPYFFRQMLCGKCRGDELLGIAASERFFREDERLEHAARDEPTSARLVQLPQARRLLFTNETAKAEALLRDVIADRPDLGEAQGRLGRIIVDRGDLAEFLTWRGGLPDAARDHPEVWFVQGLQARRLGQLEGATRCYLEVLARSPNHLGANVQIAGCLERLGQSDAAGAFSRRAELLAELESLLNLMRESSDQNLFAKAVTLYGKLGRYWEAAGWCHVMMRFVEPHPTAQGGLRHWLPLALGAKSPTAEGALPSSQLNREAYAMPRWPLPTVGRASSDEKVAPPRRWRFVDDAARAGLDFHYYEGTTEANRLEHIFNTMGGGLAALDYDLDGWPDLYFAQAHNWRNPDPQPEHFDRLFRNAQGEQFLDVTRAAQIGDESFSHGVTVGDFDQDGFPDVYIGNKGPNRLYRNHGDGTFSDVTAQADVAGNEWSTSSVFADFSGDGLPDLYVLNYTLLDETARKECQSGGDPMACTPDMLTAEHDRLYLNLGDGRFRDVSSQSGILFPDGRGLGVVVWDYAGDGRLSAFIANDTTPNFLLVNQGVDADGVPHFADEALVRGVALDADGNALASMGVAAGDVTGDGRIELFITNFFASSNAFFSQRADGFFDDLTRQYQLRDASFWMLGFGCQFADFDCDGWEDIVITNGHVDQRSSRGDPDRMPPQVYLNLEGRRFDEIPSEQLGAFFEGRYLGRGLALLDWNRDGRTDFAVSHLHAPASLVTNETDLSDRPLVVRLAGRTGCREPIGASVTLRVSGREFVRLQTGGDGFLVTNEHRLHFAVPSEQDRVELEVRWPGGKRETWTGIPAGCEVLLIEGRRQAFVLRQLPFGGR